MGAFQIPLAVDHPTFGTSPQEAQGRMNLKQMAGAQQIQQQVIAENKLKLQAQQEDQDDQQVLQDAFRDSVDDKGNFDYEKVRSKVAPKVRFRNLQAFEKMHNDLLKGTMEMDSTRRAHLLEKNTSVGNELMGLLQTPKEQRRAAAAASRQRLVQLGDIAADDPEYADDVPLDDDSIKAHLGRVGYAKHVQELATAKANEERAQAMAAQADAKARDEESKMKAAADQREMEKAAADYSQVTDQSSHDAWLSKLPKDIQSRMPKVFDKDKTSTIVQNKALTTQQRQANSEKAERADAEARRALLAGGETGLAFLQYDPTVSEETRNAAKKAHADVLKYKKKDAGGMTENQQQLQADKDRAVMIADRDRFDKVRDQEVAKWGEVSRIDNALSNAGSTTEPVENPFGAGKITVQELKAMGDAARARAQELNKSGKEILRQRGWGEFAAGAPPVPESKPAPVAPPPAAGTPKTADSKAGASKKPDTGKSVTIKLQDGRFLTFPSQEAADAAAAKYGFTYNK